MRVAIYYAPAPHDPLWQAGSTWLGRDAETAAAARQPAIPALPELTADPRLYGFHATLKPPMRLATSYGDLLQDARALAARQRPFELPPLAVTDLRGFLALCDTVPSPALQALADACVEQLDRHRVPPDDAELARRRRHGLPPAQEAMLVRWGYPHVLTTWFFHMTLTRRLSATERDQVMPRACDHFAEVLAQPRQVDALCLFTQAAPGAPFLIAERIAFGG